MKDPRVATEYIVTRRQARYIAHRKMKEEGRQHINRHSYSTYTTETGRTYTTYNPSDFSENWRKFVTWPQKEKINDTWN